MATQTLAEISKMLNDDIVGGVIETVLQKNRFLSALPYVPYSGNAVRLTDAGLSQNAKAYLEGATIDPAVAETYTNRTFGATSYIVNAEVSNLAAAVSQSSMVDGLAVEISRKSVDLATTISRDIVSGDGVAPKAASLFSQTTQTLAPVDPVNGDALSFARLDELLDSIEGQADALVMSLKQARALKALLRSAGGIDPVQLKDGTIVDLSYSGIPVFATTDLPDTETVDGLATVGGTFSSVYAIKFDSGNLNDGVAIIHPEATPAGFAVEKLGSIAQRDVTQARVKWYGNFVVASPLASARLFGLI